MKVLNTQQIRSADAYTIEHEPIASIDLMERAARVCFEKIIELIPDNSTYHIYCGTGNNGGDGLVIARLLESIGKDVHVYVVRFSDYPSADFEINLNRLNEYGVNITNLYPSSTLAVPSDGIIIDAMLGTGVTRPLSGLLKNAAELINSSGLPVFAVDLPSGLYDHGNREENLDVCVRASFTLSFQVPKLCFFLNDTATYLGKWYVIDIGLDRDYIKGVNTPYQTYEMENAIEDLINRDIHSHKGNYGHCCLAVGSVGKMGAAVLSAESCLRSGSGLLTCYLPKCGYEIMQQSLPEAMVVLSNNEDVLDNSADLSKFSVIGVGPGIGTSSETSNFLGQLIHSSNTPLVLDADALNIISANKALLGRLPENSILTPHPKEFERLFGPTSSSEARLDLLQKTASDLRILIVLKGHYTATALPNGTVFFNTTGNPGMATGGSGDVLTGIITSLLGQGYTAEKAALLGVFIHGLAGDLAASKLSQEAMIASDITDHLGAAFKSIHACQE